MGVLSVGRISIAKSIDNKILEVTEELNEITVTSELPPYPHQLIQVQEVRTKI